MLIIIQLKSRHITFTLQNADVRTSRCWR